MKVIIAGSRSITDYSLVEQAVTESGFEITEVVLGAARGVDRLGELWAAEHFVPVKRFASDRSQGGLPGRSATAGWLSVPMLSFAYRTERVEGRKA